MTNLNQQIKNAIVHALGYVESGLLVSCSDLLCIQEIRSMERVSAQCCCIQYIVIEIFDCKCNDLELGRFKVIQGKRWSKMVPIESPLVVSYLTSIVSNVVSRTVFEIFDPVTLN